MLTAALQRRPRQLPAQKLEQLPAGDEAGQQIVGVGAEGLGVGAAVGHGGAATSERGFGLVGRDRPSIRPIGQPAGPDDAFVDAEAGGDGGVVDAGG